MTGRMALRSSCRWAAVLAIAAGSLFGGRAVLAQTAAPDISVRPSSDRVEVGELFTIELKAMGDRGTSTPTDADLRVPQGLTVVGKSESSQTMINGFGPGASIRVGIGVTWQVVGEKPGRYVIPGPTVVWNGHRLSSSKIQIQVTPTNGRPRRQPHNPFLGPGGPGFTFPWSFRGEPPLDEDEASDPRAVAELAMPAAPDPVAFLRAVIDKKTVVIGEQVTLSFYVYFRSELGIANPHEAPLADFVRMPLLKNPGGEPVVLALVGGKRYNAKLLDKMAIFPVRAGDLRTGSLRMTFTGGRFGRGVDRETIDQVIHVTEPPSAGRPPGYAMGDVGRFSLSATVQPRQIEQGGALAVTIKVTGAGNLPQSLHVPERVGVEWLDPERKEAVESQKDVITGWRTFGYVVRIGDTGKVDLGDVTLPYWDSIAKKYQVARVELGSVDVKAVALPADAANPASSAAPASIPPADPFATLPPARLSLGAYSPPRDLFFDGRSLWFVIAIPPLFVGFSSVGAGALRRLRDRRASRRESPAALAAKALNDIDDAEHLGDPKKLATALERALHLSVEASTGLKSRGVLVADLPAEVERRGVSHDLGDRIALALSECDTIRFDPKLNAATTRDLVARVRALGADLARHQAS